MPRWNSPAKRRRSSSSGSQDRFESRSRSREKNRGPPQYNRTPSPRYRPGNRKGSRSPIPKKQSSNQRNRSFSPDDYFKGPQSKNKRSSDGYRGRSFSPEVKRKPPTKSGYDRDKRSDGKFHSKQGFSPERYDKRSGGKGTNRRGSDQYKQSSSKKDNKKGYKRGSRSRSTSPPQRSGSRKKEYYDNQKQSTSRKHHDIDPSEIRININTAKPSPPRNIFNVEELVIPRRKDEGTKPLFDRPELRQRSYYDTQDNLDEERRVVSVKKNNDSIEYMQNISAQVMPRKQPIMHPVSNIDQFQGNSAMFQYSSLSNHDLNMSAPKLNQNIYQQHPQQNTYSQIELQPQNVMQSNLQPAMNDPPMYTLPTSDLRHCIKSRRSPKESDHSRKEKRSRDRSYERSKSQQETRKTKASPGSHHINDRIRKLANPDQSQSKLPNFRKELEVIQKEESWKFDPTSIPKGTEYFEHDDRGHMNSVRKKVALPVKHKTELSSYKPRGSSTFRGFGRSSSFSSRGFASRRGFAGRGASRSSMFFGRGVKRSSPSWKHDKYDGKKGSKTTSSKSSDKLGSKHPRNPARKEQDKRSSSSRK